MFKNIVIIKIKSNFYFINDFNFIQNKDIIVFVMYNNLIYSHNL